MNPTLDILDRAAMCFTAARQQLTEGAALLYQIKTQNAWEGRFSSFSAFLEAECKISDGMASKLIQVYQFYVVDSGFSQAKIEGIDSEKLYLALRLDGPPEQKLASAQTLSRGELRKEVADPNDECQHDNQGLVCFSCHVRL